MEFGLTCRQPLEYQKKADVLIVNWEDRKGILNLGHDFPDKKFLLLLPNEEINSQELVNCNIYCHNNLYCQIKNVEQKQICQDAEIKFFFPELVTTFQQAEAMKAAGASILRIGAPLTHNLKKVKELNMLIMITLNNARDDSISLESNPRGAWFRPEDYELWSKYIDIGIFAHNDLQQERGFYRVYAENREWKGELKDLIFGLNYDGRNTLIPPTLAERRLECRQICYENHTCAFCDHTLQLANPELLKKRIQGE